MTRKDRYHALVDDLIVEHEREIEAEPDRWLIMSRELFGDQVTDTFFLTYKDQRDALEGLADEVLAGRDPDPEYGLVDLDTGEGFTLNVRCIVTVAHSDGEVQL
jgi:hypothetical protein